MIKFESNAIAKKYVILSKVDQVVELPEGYKGPLSKIPKIDMVRAMVERRSNLVAPKETAPNND